MSTLLIGDLTQGMIYGVDVGDRNGRVLFAAVSPARLAEAEAALGERFRYY